MNKIKTITPYLDMSFDEISSKIGNHIFTNLSQAIDWLLAHPDNSLYWYGHTVTVNNGTLMLSGKESNKWDIIFGTVNSIRDNEIKIKNSDGYLNYVSVI